MRDGIVIELSGKVLAIATDGKERSLNLGDKVSAGEQIVTGDYGTVSIKFADGLIMDLGRNDQSLLDEESLSLDFDVEPKNEVATAEVEAAQEALLTNKEFDPTLDLDPAAAGQVAAVEGAGEDDGFTVVKVDYAEPRMTPVSGFETTGISFEFTEIIPVLILDPEAIQGDGLVGAVAADGITPPGSSDPVASIFTINERFVESGPDLIEGDSSNGLGFRVEPDTGDTITSVTIKGFPENSNPAESDWLVFPDAQVLDQNANYQVNFLGNGPIQSEDGTWEVGVEILGALPGESVEFILTVIPFGNISNSVPLEIETTVDGSEGASTSSTTASVGISFEQLFFSSSSSGSVSNAVFLDTEDAVAQADSNTGFISLETGAVINSFTQQTSIETVTTDVL